MAVDGGKIRVLVQLDTEDLEDELEQAYKDLDKFSKEAQNLAKTKIQLETEIELKKGALERKINEIKEKAEAQTIGVKSDIQAERISEVAQAKINALTKEYEAYVQQANVKINDINNSINSNTASQQQLNAEINAMNRELDRRDNTQAINDDFNNMVDKTGDLKANIKDILGSSIGDLNKKINNIGKSIQGVTRKVAKWGLAIFSIRSAYNLIRSSVSQVTQGNEELANKLAVIKGALASAIEPIITKIINLIYTLLSFINTIVTKLTGKNLFAAAKKNLASGAKSSKEINKQLAGFDEQTVLSDNSGGGGADLSGLGNVETGLLDVLEQFKQYFNEGNFGAIAQIISEKVVGALNTFADKLAGIDWSAIGKGISDFLTNIDFSGIFVGLARVFGEATTGFINLMLAIDWPTILANFTRGIADAIFKIAEYASQVDWAGIGQKLSDTFLSIDWVSIGSSILTLIWEGFKGLGTLIANIDWVTLGQSILNGIGELFIQITEMFSEIDWTLLGADIADAIWEFITTTDWLSLGTNILLGILSGLEAIVDLVAGLFVELWNKILEFFGIHSPSTLAKDMGINIMEGLQNGIKAMIDTIVNVFKTIWGKIKVVFSVVGTWFKDRFKEAWTNIKNVFSSVGSFFGGIWDTIKSKFTTIGTKVGEVVGGAFKNVINGVLGAIENILNFPIKQVNKLLDVINAIPTINIKKLSTFSLPRLAKGGIINMPNKGVMVGQAVGGESGREGVIPLTDSQQMQLLGEAIGRYITINASITNTMNGRVISRELQKINNENDFAFNR